MAKKQVAIKDHIRSKMILFKHHEHTQVEEIINYLQNNYKHFSDKEIQLWVEDIEIPGDVTLANLFSEYNYSADKMLEVKFVSTPTPAPAPADIMGGEDATIIGKVFPSLAKNIDVKISEHDFELVSELSVKEAFPKLISGPLAIFSKVEKFLKLMLQLYQNFSEKPNLDHVLKSLLEVLFDLLNLERGVVLLYDSETGELIPKHEKTQDTAHAKLVISQKLVRNIEERRTLMVISPASGEYHLAIPLLWGKQLLGIVYLIGADEGEMQSEDILYLLSAAVSYSGLAVENSLLLLEIEQLLSKRD